MRSRLPALLVFSTCWIFRFKASKLESSMYALDFSGKRGSVRGMKFFKRLKSLSFIMSKQLASEARGVRASDFERSRAWFKRAMKREARVRLFWSAHRGPSQMFSINWKGRGVRSSGIFDEIINRRCFNVNKMMLHTLLVQPSIAWTSELVLSHQNAFTTASICACFTLHLLLAQARCSLLFLISSFVCEVYHPQTHQKVVILHICVMSKSLFRTSKSLHYF